MASWTIAKDILNDADKARLACVYFHLEAQANVNWDAAAKDYGSSTTNSFRTMIYAAMKKVKEAAAKSDGDETSAPPDTPKAATTPGKRGRKRKDADDSATPDTPATKKSRGKGKKAVAESVENGVEEEGKVKEEDAGDSA